MTFSIKRIFDFVFTKNEYDYLKHITKGYPVDWSAARAIGDHVTIRMSVLQATELSESIIHFFEEDDYEWLENLELDAHNLATEIEDSL